MILNVLNVEIFDKDVLNEPILTTYHIADCIEIGEEHLFPANVYFDKEDHLYKIYKIKCEVVRGNLFYTDIQDDTEVEVELTYHKLPTKYRLVHIRLYI